MARSKKTRLFRHVHQSGKSGKVFATKAEWKAMLDTHSVVGGQQIDLITLTETSSALAGEAVHEWATENKWHIYRPTGYGPDEITLLSRTPLSRRRARRLTRLTLRSARKAPIYDVSAVVCGVRWHNWHSPAHNEGLAPNWPTKVYLSALRTLRLVGKGLHAYTGDWNVDLGNPKMRQRLRLPGMRWAVGPNQKGTLGKRIIDGVQTNVPIVRYSVTLPACKGFDHHAIYTVLEIAA